MTDHRFLRFSALVGEESFEKLKKAHIVVFGVGGVGSFLVESLARCGVGELTLVDFDTIAIHNINRQLHALTSTVGCDKVDIMARRIEEINPQAKIHIFKEKLTEDNISLFHLEDCDYIADAIDDVPAKVTLIQYGQNQGIPVLSAMGTGNKVDPTQLEVSDIAKTSVCPLCRSVRRRLREIGIEKGVKVVYSREIPIKSPLEEMGRPVPASSSFVPSSAGLIMASRIVNELLKKE